MDPWTVLGVSRNATEEEIKKAYRELAKKYHPDRYASAAPEMQELAAEKMRQINEAYDTLTRPGGTSSSYDQPGSGSYSGYGNPGVNDYRQRRYTYESDADQTDRNFGYIRQMINADEIPMAESLLDRMAQRPAEWYFLRGMCYVKRGWYEQASQYLSIAVQMDPGNAEYRSVLTQMNDSTRSYAQRTSGAGTSPDWCTLCQCLLCSDCCCECMGGDLCSCF